jgi:predicted negative regulator of RcsB-dependent stress response
VDTQTRHNLKKDKFAQAAADSASWVSGHRSGVLRWVIVGGVTLILTVGALIFWSLRSTAADTALGAAMDTYNAPLAQPGLPAGNGIYATSADRTKAANSQFAAVVQQYGWLPQGTKARYFLGITDEEMGQNASAETELKAASGAWDRNLSNLAKRALAGLYRQTARDAQAIEIYNGLVSKPSETVSAAVAQLDLADLYVTQGKQDQARTIWAKVKDADKDGTAGSIATQKLAGK